MTESMADIEFTELMRERFADLTKSGRRIAQYVLGHQDEAAFLSAAALADRLGLSEATVIRFAQALGFRGFPEMRCALQDSFRSHVSHSARLRGRLEDLRQVGDIFERLTASEIDYLSQALRTVDREAMYHAVDLLRARQRVFLYGLGPSVALVELLTTRLRRFRRDVIQLTTGGREILDRLLLMTEGDLLFAVGFFDVNPTLDFVINHARKCNCPAILLTDTLASLFSDRVDVVLAALRGPVSAFHSLTVPMTITNTLLLALAQTDQERFEGYLDGLDDMRRAYASVVRS
jgi:DNA-binding MurR/RpiR family transcriptional regulator